MQAILLIPLIISTVWGALVFVAIHVAAFIIVYTYAAKLTPASVTSLDSFLSYADRNSFEFLAIFLTLIGLYVVRKASVISKQVSEIYQGLYMFISYFDFDFGVVKYKLHPLLDELFALVKWAFCIHGELSIEPRRGEDTLHRKRGSASLHDDIRTLLQSHFPRVGDYLGKRDAEGYALNSNKFIVDVSAEQPLNTQDVYLVKVREEHGEKKFGGLGDPGYTDKFTLIRCVSDGSQGTEEKHWEELSDDNELGNLLAQIRPEFFHWKFHVEQRDVESRF